MGKHSMYGPPQRSSRKPWYLVGQSFHGMIRDSVEGASYLKTLRSNVGLWGMVWSVAFDEPNSIRHRVGVKVGKTQNSHTRHILVSHWVGDYLNFPGTAPNRTTETKLFRLPIHSGTIHNMGSLL